MKKLFSRNFKWLAGLALIVTGLAGCLNPLGFDSDFKVKVEISGDISTMAKDYAVLWIINRTNTVDVSSVTIGREDTPQGYPKEILNKPLHNSTHASYHVPTDKSYSIDLQWVPFGLPAGRPGGYSDAECTGSWQIPAKYMPNAGKNYFIYLFRNKSGEIQIVEEEQLVDPDPSDVANPSLPLPSDMYPLIVKNATKSARIDTVEFGQGYTLGEGVAKGDEFRISLPDGQFAATVNYTPDGSSGAHVTKNVNVVQSLTAQSWHLLYLWFYKTKNGNYSISQMWPPVPNDASDEDNQTVLGDNDGGLQVINKSENGSRIIDIKIGDNVVYSGDSNGHIYKDDSSPVFVLPAGTHYIKFKTNKTANGFGPAHPIRITKGQIRTLSFYDALDDLDTLPPDINNQGVGMIKIVNNSDKPAIGVEVLTLDTIKHMTIDSSYFQPTGPVNGGDEGRVDVVGNTAFPITAQEYLIYVRVRDFSGEKTVRKIAYLKDRIVTITINPGDIPPDTAPSTIGATINVVNNVGATYNTWNVSARISTIMVYNKVTLASSPFNTTNGMPAGGLPNTGTNTASFRVLDTPAMPIQSGSTFTTIATVFITVEKDGNSRQGYAAVNIPLTPDEYLYSTNPATHTRTATLTSGLIQNELGRLTPAGQPPAGSGFTPVTDVDLHAITPAIGTNQLVWDVIPTDATNNGEVSGTGRRYWTFGSGAAPPSSQVTNLTSDGAFTVLPGCPAIEFYVAIIIPNGIALGPRNSSNDYTVTNAIGDTHTYLYDPTVDFIKTFKFTVGASSGGGGSGGGASTYQVKIMRNSGSGSGQSSQIDKVVFRPTSEVKTWGDYQTNRYGYLISGVALPSSYPDSNTTGDIVVDVSSLRSVGANVITTIPEGNYNVFEVVGSVCYGLTPTGGTAYFRTDPAWHVGNFTGTCVWISYNGFYKGGFPDDGQGYPVTIYPWTPTP